MGFNINFSKVLPESNYREFHRIQDVNTSQRVTHSNSGIENQSFSQSNIVIFSEDEHFLCLNYKQWSMLSMIMIGAGLSLGLVALIQENKI